MLRQADAIKGVAPSLRLGRVKRTVAPRVVIGAINRRERMGLTRLKRILPKSPITGGVKKAIWRDDRLLLGNYNMFKVTVVTLPRFL